MSTDSLMVDLLELLVRKTRERALEWVAQAQDRFLLEVAGGTVVLTSTSNIVVMYPSSVASTTSPFGEVTRLAVFNPNGIEVANLQSTQVEPIQQLQTLFDLVRDQALGAEKVISNVIRQVEAKSQERRPRRSTSG